MYAFLSTYYFSALLSKEIFINLQKLIQNIPRSFDQTLNEKNEFD